MGDYYEYKKNRNYAVDFIIPVWVRRAGTGGKR